MASWFCVVIALVVFVWPVVGLTMQRKVAIEKITNVAKLDKHKVDKKKIENTAATKAVWVQVGGTGHPDDTAWDFCGYGHGPSFYYNYHYNAGYHLITSSSDGEKIAVAVWALGNILTSSDGGKTWANNSIEDGPGNNCGKSWAGICSSSDGSRLTALTEGGAVWISIDGGKTWEEHRIPSSCSSISCSSDGLKLAAACFSGIFTSNDGGFSWVNSQPNKANRDQITSSSDGTRLAATMRSFYYYWSYYFDIWISGDEGSTWTENAPAKYRGVPYGPPGTDWAFVQFAAPITSSSDGLKLAAAVNGGNIWISSDGGNTWVEQIPTGEYPGGLGRIGDTWRCITSSSDGLRLAAATAKQNKFWYDPGSWLEYGSGYIWISSDGGNTWTNTSVGEQKEWTSITSSSDGFELAAVAYDGTIWRRSIPHGGGDPHMVNILGEKFDLWRLGEVELLRIPQESTAATAKLQMFANVTDAGKYSGDDCAEAPYMTSMSFRGSWFDAGEILVEMIAGEMSVSVGGESLKPSFKPVTIGGDVNLVMPSKSRVTLNVGRASIDVLRDMRAIHFFLNTKAENLDSLSLPIGGVLGIDDHTLVAQRPSHCPSA